MERICNLHSRVAKGLKVFFTDIDGTLTDEGKLLPSTYASIWRLYEAGLIVVPVTGRSAGWCDLILRQWPVGGVIAENGAIAFYMKDGRRQSLVHPNAIPKGREGLLPAIRERILGEFKESRVAADQFTRLYDLAIDYAEEEPRMGRAFAESTRELAESMGAIARVSSTHINIAAGDYDKASMAGIFLSRALGIEPILHSTVSFFVGDSSNDEPMFKVFQNSCGVANIKGESLSFTPSFVSEQCAGKGFSEIVEVILSLRLTLT